MRQAVEVHHIKHTDEYPELAFDPDNVVSLCSACHRAQHPERAEEMNRLKGRDRY